MQEGKTVLLFTKIQFKGNWIRSGDTLKAIYKPSIKGDELNVVWQSKTGKLKTYIFSVPLDPIKTIPSHESEVWVNWEHNTIHIPVIWNEIPKDRDSTID